ncbi:MAG: hypothetical protein KKG53_08385 [Proteobacteria bacterium]|nr:hypothetical protein [Pseudomonadota bacterium]
MKYLMQYLVIVSFLFSSNAWGGLFKPELKDVILISLSGYTYFINYKESPYIHLESDYNNLIVNTLVKEMKQATSECEQNKQLLKHDSGALNPDVKEIYDSLKIENEFDDYRIISAILAFYARNRDDIYFHDDIRIDHPECFGVNETETCKEFRKDYYFKEDTPINGTVPRSLNGAAAETDCQQLMNKLLPAGSNNVCAELKPLKSCLAEVSEIDDKVGAQRRTNGAPKAGKNSIFDQFGTQEIIER